MTVFRPFALMLLALAASFPMTAARADTLIDNVAGVTMDAGGHVQRFNGIVVGNDGRVVRLLQRGDARPARPDFRKDAHGAVMLPGLIDAHGHVMELGFRAELLDLSATRSLAEAQAAIAAYAAAHPDLPWVMGGGWNQELWGLGRFPTAADLDAVVPGRPVWLERVDGHAGWANSKAMQAAGVTAADARAGGWADRTAACGGSRSPRCAVGRVRRRGKGADRRASAAAARA